MPKEKPTTVCTFCRVTFGEVHKPSCPNAGRLMQEPEAATRFPRLRVTVSATIECALQLDDSGMLKHHGLTAIPSSSRTRGTYEGKPAAIVSLLEDLHSRGFGGGWDQPASWARACRAAYTRITKELAAQGYDITTEMEKVGRVAIPCLVLKQR